VKFVPSAVILILGFCFFSCADIGQSQFQTLEYAEWSKSNTLSFEFSITDTLSRYDILIHIRNNKDYDFSNIFLVSTLDFPESDKTIVDTLEYEMTDVEGNWLGQSQGTVVENIFFFREGVVFPEKGKYEMSFNHLMRRKGFVGGLSALKGITDVGVEIKPENNQ
tara:strand:+ start:24902 stop:25396 length:495 start_codon:yes stop_codon:yes gene_type:complete